MPRVGNGGAARHVVLAIGLLALCSLAGACTSDDPDTGPSSTPTTIRGRFESAAPIRACDEVATWQGPDGFLLRPTMTTCGDDIEALARTIVANLDAAAARGARVMLTMAQGTNLPPSWLADCETYTLDDPRFAGPLCVPWDPQYQAHLRSALMDVIGPAVSGHPALAGVYFTISTMTNGSEMHFRVERSGFPYPGDDVFRGAYLDVMDIFQESFDVPIVFEGGHCIWLDVPAGAVEPVDCETPLALYRHARDTYGADQAGIALWNCAERFWASATAEGAGVRGLIEEVSADRVSIGCQTVGSFTNGACRFTDENVSDYGTPGAPGSGDTCPVSETFDPEGACVDTMSWFAGVSAKNVASVAIRGTWSENWSKDFAVTGVYQTSASCRAAIDRLAP